MHSRVARVMLVSLLLAAGTGAALQARFLLAQARQLDADERALLAEVARFDAVAADLSAAQAAYVAPGQPDAPWVERVSSLAPQLTTIVSSLRASSRSAASALHIQAVSDALSQLAVADASAREYLQQEQDLMAADVVFGEAREAISTARAAALAVGKAERESFLSARAANQERLFLIVGGAAGLWVIGLLVLMPGTIRAAETAVDFSQIAPAPATTAPVAQEASGASPVDLPAAADLCAALSRVVSAAALPDMLARTASLLDAAGIIVWLGTGDELYAATSHGYHPRVISRLGSIPRAADNATAAAWRTGELRTVPGDAMSNGAIVAPMFGPDGCIGVLAAEVRHGREQDSATRAVTTMVAAQLATVLAAWPSAPPARAAEA